MTDTDTVTREDLLAAIVASGADTHSAALAADAIPAEHRRAAIDALRETQVAKDALRDRLRAHPLLSRAVCPAADWKDGHARYDTARRAVRLVDAWAEKAKVTADEIAQALIDGQGTVADTIALHGGDPRTVEWGKDFYAFRWRLQDAYEVVTAEEQARIRREREAARDAAWERQGLTRCDRCGGAGGASHWPGFTCYGCDGRGAVSVES